MRSAIPKLNLCDRTASFAVKLPIALAEGSWMRRIVMGYLSAFGWKT